MTSPGTAALSSLLRDLNSCLPLNDGCHCLSRGGGCNAYASQCCLTHRTLQSLPSKVASAKLALAANESSPRADDGSTYGATTPAKAPVTVRLSPTSSDGPTSTLALLRDGHVRGVLTACFLLQFTWIGYETVWVLWAYTPLSLGGIERTVCPSIRDPTLRLTRRPLHSSHPK